MLSISITSKETEAVIKTLFPKKTLYSKWLQQQLLPTIQRHNFNLRQIFLKNRKRKTISQKNFMIQTVCTCLQQEHFEKGN